jgi:hypothetical protein
MPIHYLKITTPMVCGGCTGTVEQALLSVEGVTAVTVTSNSCCAEITTSDDKAACACSKSATPHLCECGENCDCMVKALVEAAQAVGFDCVPVTKPELEACITAGSGGPCGKPNCTCGPNCQCGDHCTCASCAKRCGSGNKGPCGKPNCTCGPNCQCGDNCKCASCGSKSGTNKGPCGKANCTCGPNCQCGDTCKCASCKCGSGNKGPCGKPNCTCGPNCQCGDTCTCATCGKTTMMSKVNATHVVAIGVALFAVGWVVASRYGRR